MWAKKFCDNNPHMDLKEVVKNFLDYIKFHLVPASVLMKDVHPLAIVPDHIIMNALAYQVSLKVTRQGSKPTKIQVSRSLSRFHSTKPIRIFPG